MLIYMSSSDNRQFSSLIDLFESIDVVEKGIEQVYDYLLRNKIVDDVKILVDELGLNLKRIYKVLSVLKELDLVRVYNRPMNVQVLDPQIALEKLINKKINEIHEEANSRIKDCHTALGAVRKAYEITDVSQQPVEFISFIGELDLETVFHAFICKRESDIAHGIWYERDVNLEEMVIQIEESREMLLEQFESAKSSKFRILVSREYLEHTKGKMQVYMPYMPLMEEYSLDQMSLDVRIFKEPFSNFIIKDRKELSQPSFDPNDNLLGYFVSSPQEIVDVFINKFNNMFESSIPLEEEYGDLEENKLQLLKILSAI